MKATTLISVISSILVFALAATSFVISYDNLISLAVESGAVDARLGFLWPFIVDGALVVFSLAVLRNSLYGERSFYPYAFVVIFSVTSVILNVVHAPENILAKVIASIAPIALLMSFETLMNQVLYEVRRNGTIQTVLEMNNAIERARNELNEIEKVADKVESPHVDNIIKLHSYQEFANFMQTGNGSRPKNEKELAQMIDKHPITANRWWEKYHKENA